MKSGPLIGVLPLDTTAQYGLWTERALIAPQALIQPLQELGASVVLLPDASSWDRRHKALDAIVVQGDDHDPVVVRAGELAIPIASYVANDEWPARAAELVRAVRAGDTP
ncbi:MAG TPA: hypothetical protein VNT22_05570 [Baekduia sp.]|nr:hypothetical protein [Baekduia sp.]